MKPLTILILLVCLIAGEGCKKEENLPDDQLPYWLQTKVTELTSEFDHCKYTNVEVIEYKGKYYYNINCALWNCIYCQIYDQKGNRPDWINGEMQDFLTNMKFVKILPACP